jgi:DMSO/TMAO reductase YedYZ molybdopterin-dependent catalytic subunit
MAAGRRTVLWLFCASVFALLGLHLAAQTAPTRSRDAKEDSRGDPRVLVRITGEVAHPQAISAPEFAKLPRQAVRARNHAGAEAQYEGVALVDLLAKAGVPGDKELKGQAMVLYVVVEASDGYRAVFALPELDRSFTDRVILLADRKDGQSLDAREGPLQVIVPGEKKHARWVRQVVQLKVGRG